MRIVESNRLDVLADDLIANWPHPKQSTLSPIRIVVPSLGVARWLTFRVASAFGICALVEFVYPANYVWTLFATVLDGLSSRSPFDAETLTWRVYRALSRDAAEPSFAPVTAYLHSGDARDRLALSRRIAQMYAEILAVRPTWPLAWQSGKLLHLAPTEHERWQSLLWRTVASEISEAAGPHPRDAVFSLLESDAALASRLPEKVVVFGVPQMAPLYQKVFVDLSGYTDVAVYLINPSEAYWFDLVGERTRSRVALTDPKRAESYDSGNRLLSALGRQIQENLVTWGVHDEDVRRDAGIALVDRFVPPARSTLLSRLQSAIFAASSELEVEPLDPADRSVSVHVCHSLARQLEVLHDQLLDAFDRSRLDAEPLLPGEVIVMVPDLDGAAPIIEAVFGAAPKSRHIAYTISGRSRDLATPILSAFFSILAMPSARFTLGQVLQLLATPAIASSLSLDDVQRDRIARWLERSGVHWGIDGANRASQGVPNEGHHTFANGLAALFLGYAVSSDEPVLFDDVIAFDGIEGKDAEALGSITRFLSDLTQSSDSLSTPRPPAAWAALWRRMIEHFFDANCDPLGEIGRLDVAITAAVAPSIVIGFNDAVPLAVMVDALKHALTQGAPGAVPSGVVTFSSFGPLRQIPYRMVCLIDLNGDGSFPRNPVRSEFDLLAKSHLMGDRNLLEEDRAAFLDAVIAATERLHVSYTGRSVRDNALLAPSSVVDDLLDALAPLLLEGRSQLGQIVVEHPLQPFSRRYFEGGPFFSYASELLPAAAQSRGPLPKFIESPLPEPEAEWLTVDIETLAKALRDPITFLLERRLGLSLRDAGHATDDDEPIQLSPLSRLRLRDKLYELHLKGVSDDRLTATARAFAESPEGVLGDVALLPEIKAMRIFADAVDAEKPEDLRTFSFSIQRGRFTLYGTLDGLCPKGRIVARLSQMNDLQLLRTWVAHLALNLVAQDAGVNKAESLLICVDEKAFMEPLANAGELLDDILELYWQGLLEPVPLLPRMSYRYATEGGHEIARRRVTNQWRGRPSGGTVYRACEARVYRIVYGAVLPQPPDGFEAISKRLYDPLYLYSRFEEIKSGIVLEPPVKPNDFTPDAEQVDEIP